eukprot:TRINITY_DN59435_c0_g1_i1.p1 TRINITY_DN59435_c0_g1~~TRINITY_DN59435_c0_g1_i1.p1  ORF type:complete len:269 (-),score=44.90 TRINITY_DN59435_c0_g1_i1:83-889(-)
MSLNEAYANIWKSLGPDNTVSHMAVIIAVTFWAHVVGYLLLYLPWFIVERTPALQKYKIQPKRRPTPEMQLHCLKGVLTQQFTGQLPLILGLPGLFLVMGHKYLDPLPEFTTIAWQCLVFLVLEDTWHYWNHRIIHSLPAVYQYVHKKHHEHHYPFGLTAEYASHSETLVLGLGTMMGPLIFKAHWVTMVIWMLVRDCETLDAHSGYDLPWSFHNWVPFWGGALYHDFHHSNFNGNYSATFTWWDKLCGTDGAFKQHIQKLKKNTKAR